jgi:hypothetical protein
MQYANNSVLHSIGNDLLCFYLIRLGLTQLAGIFLVGQVFNLSASQVENLRHRAFPLELRNSYRYSMSTQCSGHHLPLDNCEAEAKKETRLASPFGMIQLQQVCRNLLLGNDSGYGVRQFHRHTSSHDAAAFPIAS